MPFPVCNNQEHDRLAVRPPPASRHTPALRRRQSMCLSGSGTRSTADRVWRKALLASWGGTPTSFGNILFGPFYLEGPCTVRVHSIGFLFSAAEVEHKQDRIFRPTF